MCLVSSVYKIAKSTMCLGELYDARAMFEQCVVNLKVHFQGDTHATVAASLSGLSQVLLLLDFKNEALLMNKEALSIRMQLDDSLEVAMCEHLMGDVYKAMEDFTSAYNCYSSAWHRIKLNGLDCIASTTLLLFEISVVLKLLNNDSEALQYSVSVIESCESLFCSDGDMECVQIIFDRSMLLKHCNKPQDAELYFMQSLKLKDLLTSNQSAPNISSDSLCGITSLAEFREFDTNCFHRRLFLARFSTVKVSLLLSERSE
jgi:hypothetical protein